MRHEKTRRPFRHPYDLSTSSRHRTLRELPIHKFVELVETNPDVTPTFAPLPGSSTSLGTSPLSLVPELVEGYRNGRKGHLVENSLNFSSHPPSFPSSFFRPLPPPWGRAGEKGRKRATTYKIIPRPLLAPSTFRQAQGAANSGNAGPPTEIRDQSQRARY